MPLSMPVAASACRIARTGRRRGSPQLPDSLGYGIPRRPGNRARIEPPRYERCNGDARRTNAAHRTSVLCMSEEPLGSGFLQLRGGVLVVRQLAQEVVDEVGAAIAEVDVVRVLPHIEHQQYLALSGRERRAGIGRLGDFQLAIPREHQPGPPGAELAHCRCFESLFEFIDATEVFGELLFEHARYATPGRRQRFPEHTVIPMLAGIVEYRLQVLQAIGGPDELFERLAFQRIVLLHQAVQRRHIGIVMFAVMQLQSLLAHAVRSQGAWSKGQWG